MSTAGVLPRIAESQGSNTDPKVLNLENSLSDSPLAIQFVQFMADLYKLSQIATEVWAGSKAHPNINLAKDIDALLHSFQLWATDISFRTSTRDASAAEVLQLLEDIKSPATRNLQKIFQQMLHDISQVAIAVPK